jgi:hypothetical protein
MMSKTAEDRVDNRAYFFKSLGHPARLLILNLIKKKPRHGEELALILMLNPATVSHHLSILVKAGLLESRKDQYYQVYSLVDNYLKRSLGDLLFDPDIRIVETVEEDAYRKKVLGTFIRRGRLTTIPAQRKKRQVILEAIAESFEPEKYYPEREVNIILLDYHDDVASLRRGLVEFGLMERTTKGVYNRIMQNKDKD